MSDKSQHETEELKRQNPNKDPATGLPCQDITGWKFLTAKVYSDGEQEQDCLIRIVGCGSTCALREAVKV